MLNCEQVRAVLGDYLDAVLPADVRSELVQHLADCRTCEVLFDTTRQTLRIVSDVGSYEVPTVVSERLVKRIMSILTSPPGSSSES
jgi:predicted anti-sigma-YlaC factor YlaD